MTLITPKQLKNNLELQGVSDSDLTDCDKLQSLIDLKTSEVTALTGLPVNPVNRKQIIRTFKGNLFESDWYPIFEVTSFKLIIVFENSDKIIFILANSLFGKILIYILQALMTGIATKLIN